MSFEEDFTRADPDDYFPLERLWKEGKHRTREGDIIDIRNMRTDHLINTIRYFRGYSISPLIEELERRNEGVLIEK